MWRQLAAVGAGLAVAGLAALSHQSAVAARGTRRLPDEGVGTAEVRSTADLQPSEHLLFNGWGVTPAGKHVPLPGDMPLKMALAPDGQRIAVVNGGFHHTGVSMLDTATGQITQTLSMTRAWNGLAFGKDGRLWVSGGASGLLYAIPYADGKLGEPLSADVTRGFSEVFLAGIAVHPETGKVYVCSEGTGQVLVVDPATMKVDAELPVAAHPHSCAFGADRRHLYVSAWGGRCVSVLDTKTGKRVRDIDVGIRPNDMALAPDGRLFVACSGDNTVRVIQTRQLEAVEPGADPTRRIPEGVREVLDTSLYPTSPEGSAPSAVAVSPDGKSLYVANADNNCVMVADIGQREASRVAGFIPVGWFPTSLLVTPDSGMLVVGNGKGLGPSANYPASMPGPRILHKGPAFDYIGMRLSGSLSLIGRPDAPGLAQMTEQVRRNSPYTPSSLRNAPVASDSVIPDQVGKPCPIKHVLYIIKENRTYDQVFGDFKDAKGKPAGNGDPSLVLYGEDVTPNQHQLARDYVLLDNLYCNGEVSVDGHAWSDAAIATDFNQRRWIVSYSRHGTLPGNDEMETPAAGYLWDLCRRQGVSFKCYGEGSARVPNVNRGTWPGGRDMDRVKGWIGDLQAAEKSGELPQLMIMSLGENHTQGTTPGAPTPEAAVGSNDVGVGRIVEAASRSKFWKEMAIFIIEDDAQNGPDHVDSHRTAGLVISPYVKRGAVDSTMYSTASMLRTMELILGLPPMTQYDAGATPMFTSFGKKAVISPFVPKTPKVDLNARNGSKAPMAALSKTLDFDEYDRAPEDLLNRILWRAAKGPGVPYVPPVRRALFDPVAVRR